MTETIILTPKYLMYQNLIMLHILTLVIGIISLFILTSLISKYDENNRYKTDTLICCLFMVICTVLCVITKQKSEKILTELTEQYEG